MDQEGLQPETNPRLENPADFINVRERVFHQHSSFGPDSHEVQSMAEQVERQGRPTTAYEFVQGMVDYQRGDPPARIFMVYRNGRKVAFNNHEPINRQGLAAVEFYNSGPGLTPEDAVIIRHGGGSETRGKWGRGTSVTLTYLASRGMTVEIESNSRDGQSAIENRAWRGKSQLRPTESGVTKVLHVDGEWLNRQSFGTTFRVLQPSKEFLDQIDALPDYFLPCHCDCDDAVVVEKNPNRPMPPLDITISHPRQSRPARARCLKGVVAYQPSPSLYVDGLKVRDSRVYSNQSYLYPWAIDGCRGLDWPYCVERSFESSETSGGDARAVIQFALSHNANPEIFKELLHAATGDSSDDDLPLELKEGYPKQKLNKDSASALLRVWQKEYGSAILVQNAAEGEKIRAKNLGTPVVVKGAMRDWLKQAGVKDATEVLDEQTHEFTPAKNIRVEYAQDPDALTKLFLEAGEAYAEPELIMMTDDKKAVRVVFPYSIGEEADLYDRLKPGATWARVAAVVANKMGLSIETKSQTGDRVTELTYEVAPQGYPNFQTALKTLTRKAEIPLSAELTQGQTTVILSGEWLQQLEPPPGLAASLAKIAQERAHAREHQQQTIRRKLVVDQSAEPKQPEVIKPEEQAAQPQELTRRSWLWKFVLRGTALTGVGALAYYWKDLNIPEKVKSIWRTRREEILKPGFVLQDTVDSSIGNPEEPLGVFELKREPGNGAGKLAVRSLDRMLRFEAGEGYDLAGYLRQFVGTVFVPNRTWGRGQWADAEEYEDINPPHAQPKNYQVKVQLFSVKGQRRLPIKDGQAVLGIESGTPVQVLREKRSRNIVISGSSEEAGALIYLGPDPAGPNKSKPIEVESRSMVDIKDLKNDWQLLIASLRSNSKLSLEEKAAIILEKWSSGYEYKDDPRLDSQVMGQTTEEISAKIINTQAGLCNTAATGLTALFREVGVPARAVAGILKSGRGTNAHMWTEFWTGKSWQEVEPLYKSKVNRVTMQNLNTYFEGIAGSDEYLATEQLAKKSEVVIRQMNESLFGRQNEADGRIKAEEGWVNISDIAKIVGGAIGGAVAKTIVGRLALRRRNLARKQKGEEME